MTIQLHYIRVGSRIFRAADGMLETKFNSISLAKRWSREFQATHGGLGKGSIRVGEQALRTVQKMGVQHG